LLDGRFWSGSEHSGEGAVFLVFTDDVEQGVGWKFTAATFWDIETLTSLVSHILCLLLILRMLRLLRMLRMLRLLLLKRLLQALLADGRLLLLEDKTLGLCLLRRFRRESLVAALKPKILRFVLGRRVVVGDDLG